MVTRHFASAWTVRPLDVSSRRHCAYWTPPPLH